MGKKRKTKDKDKNKEEDEYIEEQTCNICFETILFGYKKKDFQPDNATMGACDGAWLAGADGCTLKHNSN